MTFLKFIETKWFNTLFGAAVTLLGIFIVHNLNERSKSEKEIREELEKRPTFEYVNEQNKALINNLNQHIQESEKTDEMLTKYIVSIDGKINILLSNDKK